MARSLIETLDGAAIPIEPKDVSSNTTAIVANGTPWFEMARWKVALDYSVLALEPLNPKDVYDTLCKDGYDNNGHSKTIVTITKNPQTGEDELSGTVRLVLGKNQAGSEKDQDGLYPLDAMGLMSAQWPHRTEGLPDFRAGELGRFVLPDHYRTKPMREAGVHKFLTSQLFSKAWEVSQASGITHLYAIMPVHVNRLVSQAGIATNEIEAARLRTDSEEAAALFAKFPRYWGLSPKLYRFIK
ncbi:MAG TPA: hypothetical protein VMR41_04785 [Patescibacteria group bacterium]|nr:hypothetical protein [Patescibacteria group bacterium]